MTKKPKSTSRIVDMPAPICTGASGGMSKEDKARQKRWMAEDDLRTLTRAEELKADPARIREAKKLAREQAACLGKIAK